jgi:hypothetical protein
VLLIPVVLVWGAMDVCRYFFFADKPSVRETVWLFGGYIAIWIIGESTDESRRNKDRLDDAESRLAALEKRNKNSN